MSLKLCRICGNNQSLVNILDKGPEMLEKLSKCANIIIKSDDILPKLICQQCDRTLNMSYLLRKQSEDMQNRLQHELLKKQSIERQKQEVVIEEGIQTESEEFDFDKKDCNAQKEEREANKMDEKRFKLDTGVAEEFVSVEHDTLDTHSESTLVASETEGLADFEGKYDNQRPTIEFTNAAESNDSYDMISNTWPRTSAAFVDNIVSTEESYDNAGYIKNAKHKAAEEILIADDEDEAIDVCDNDETSNHNYVHSDSSSNLLRPQGCLSISMMSNYGSPTPDNDTEYHPRSATIPYTCITCHEVFTRKKDYKEHIAQHGPNRYQCIQCLAAFPTRYRLIRHEAIHTDGAAYKCSECNRQYRMAYNLQRHILSCHSEKAKYQCHVCRLNYTRADVLKRHMAQVHAINKKWHCKNCGMSFRSVYYLNEHKTKDLCTKPKPKPTNPVSMVLPNIPAKQFILGQDNKYKCVFCNMKFTALANCKTHLLIHNNIKPFPCSMCPKSFRTRYAMTNHERIHNDERPFECEFCSKTFRQVTHLKHHRVLHTKDMPVKCPECEAGFVTKWKLREHLRKEHYTMKAFKCAECPEEFFLKYDLKRHAKIVHLRSVSIADSDNEGVKQGSTQCPDITSDSERSLHVDQDNGVVQYNDIEEMYDTDVAHAQTNIEGVTNFSTVQGHEETPDQAPVDIIDIAEDTDREDDDDDDVHIVEDYRAVDGDNVNTHDEPHPHNMDMDTNSQHMFVLNDVEEMPLPPPPDIANDNANEPEMNFETPIMDCIHLDSSNSCKSPPSPAPPPASDTDYFEQEEEIHITEEKIERFTRFFDVENIPHS